MLINSRMLRYIVASIVLLIFNAPPIIAASSIDSIKSLLTDHQQKDEKRVDLLLSLADRYYYTAADSQLIYAKEALALSEKLNYPHGMAIAYSNLGRYAHANNKVDSSLYYYEKGMEICDEHNLPADKSTLYTNVGHLYLRMAQYNDAFLYYDSAITLGEKANNEEMVAIANSSIASVYSKMGSYPEALRYYLLALDVYKKLDRYEDIASDLANIAVVYLRLGDFEKALEYNREGFRINKKAGAKWGMIANLNTYAMIFDERKQYDSSRVYIQEALDIANEMKNTYLINLLEGNLAEVYLNIGDYEKAYQLYDQTLTVSKKLDDAEGIAIAHAGKGKVMLKTNRFSAGVAELKTALGMMTGSGVKEQVIDITEALSTGYEEQGDYKQALYYNKLYNNYKDSIAAEQSQKEMQQVQFEYELDKKEQKIDLLEKDKAIEEGRIRTKNIVIIAALIGMVLAAIIAYQFFRKKEEEHRGQELIRAQKEEIEKQNLRLEELNDFKDKTFSVLSHDLRSPINALASTMMLLDEELITPKEFAEFRQELNNKLQAVSLLMDNLLQWAKSQMKGEHIHDPEMIDMKRKGLKSIAVHKDAAGQKEVQLVNKVPDGLHAFADKTQIEMVVRNLVSNAIKFTPAGGVVTLTGRDEGDMVSLSVSDNGVGMTADQMDKLFDGNLNNSTVGTSGEKGTGIGINLSYRFVQMNDGTMEVHSDKGAGTTFTIKLPKFTS